MRMQKLVVACAGCFAAAMACTDSVEHTTGMRVDGVKVDCTAQSADVSSCAAVADACDVATVLWPPNHKMKRFTLEDCALPPECGGGGSGSGSGSGSDGPIERTLSQSLTAGTHITSITADEAIEVGKGGDGHTIVEDIAYIDPVTFDLRSERQGGGDGRVYRVHFVDGAGVEGACEFHVPHNQGPTAGALDSGTVVTLTAPPAP